MIITVFGLGFVGLTTALGFAQKGHKVYGYEINQKRVDTLNNKRLNFAMDDPLSIKAAFFNP